MRLLQSWGSVRAPLFSEFVKLRDDFVQVIDRHNVPLTFAESISTIFGVVLGCRLPFWRFGGVGPFGVSGTGWPFGALGVD
jgi:hypothetical protein